MRLPALDEPAPGTHCPTCQYELRIEGFCPVCYERRLEAREQEIEAQLEEARARTRAWKHAKSAGLLERS